MILKKRLFLIVFYTTLLTFTIGHFSNIFINNYINIYFTSASSFMGVLSTFTLLYLISIITLLFIDEIITYFSRKDYLIMSGVAFILSFGFVYYYKLNIIPFIILALLCLLYFTGFYFYKSFRKEKNTLINQFYQNLFYLLILMIILISSISTLEIVQENSKSNTFSSMVYDSNFLILDVVNENTIEILTPHYLNSYNLGFSNGYFEACKDLKQTNCTISNNTNSVNSINTLLDNNLVLFNKADFYSDIQQNIDDKYGLNFFMKMYIISITALLTLLSVVMALLSLILRYFTKYTIKYFSWLFDPLGVEKYKK